MLIELWERLRGYDKWIQTEATIKSSTTKRTYRRVKGGRQDIWFVTNTIVWTARQGQTRSADFYLDDISLLKHFVVGETVTIRYNPLEPSIFYLRKLFQITLCRRIKWTALLLSGIVIFALIARFH